MKKITVILFLIFFGLFSACSNHSDEAVNKDSTYNESPAGPAPDNSNATNPSLGDTTYTDSTHIKK